MSSAPEPPVAGVHAPRLVLAILASAALVISAPFVGQARSAIRNAFPGAFGTIVNSAVAGVVAALCLLVLWRIRERRALRLGALATALTLAAGYIWVFSTGIRDVDAVERFHFVEYGVVTLLFYRAWRGAEDSSPLLLAALCALIVGTIEEWFQWFIPARIGELRDVFLNGFAIACGLLLAVAAYPPARFSRRLAARSRTRVAVTATVLLVALGVFVRVVHVGHEITEEGVATFKSRYTKQELESLARDRAARWRAHPPRVLRRLSREDQYMNEGVWHVQRRNEQWEAGRVFESWRENRILERFYAPVLDTPSYISNGGHRWPAAQRADAETRAADEGQPYVSDANRESVYVWPPAALWGVVILAAGVLLAGGVRGRTS